MSTVYCNDATCEHCDVCEWECSLDSIHLRGEGSPDIPHALECVDRKEREIPDWEEEETE